MADQKTTTSKKVQQKGKVRKSRFAKNYAFPAKAEALYALEKFAHKTMRIVMNTSAEEDDKQDVKPDKKMTLSVPKLLLALTLIFTAVYFLFQKPDTTGQSNEPVEAETSSISEAVDSDVTITVTDSNITEIVYINHKVVKGDTLWRIANKYFDDPYRYPELAALNKINNPHLIYPGNTVKIIKQPAQ